MNEFDQAPTHEDVEERYLLLCLGEPDAERLASRSKKRTLQRTREAPLSLDAPLASVIPDKAGGTPQNSRTFAIAAALLLGTAVILGVRHLCSTEGRKPADQSSAPRSDVTPPVESLDDIRRLPRDTNAVRGLGLGAAEIQALARLPHLRRLDLSMPKWPAPERDSVGADGMASLGKLRGLEWLSLAGQKGLRGSLGALRGLDQLQTLSLKSTDVRDEDLEVIPDLTALRDLSLEDCLELGQEALAPVLRHGRLRALRLHGTAWLSEAALSRLSELEELRILELDHVDGVPNMFYKDRYASGVAAGVTNRVLASLAQLPALEELDISGAKKITPVGLAGLARYPKLRRLRINNTRGVDENVLATLPTTLTELGVAMAQLSGENLARFRQLRTLDLTHCKGLGDATIAALLQDGPRQSLTALNLTGTQQLTPRALELIARFPELKRLTLSQGTWFGPGDLRRLGGLRGRLQFLDLSWHPKLTDEGLRHLEGFHALRTLKLVQTPQISDAAARALRARLSGVEIELIRQLPGPFGGKMRIR